MTITKSSPNNLATPTGSSTVNDNTLLHTPRFYSQCPGYYSQYTAPLPQQPQYIHWLPQLPPLPQLPQLPQYVPHLPQLPQYIPHLPQLPQYIPHLPPQSQYVQHLPQLPYYDPSEYQYVHALQQLPIYYPDGNYCEIQYVSPQIVSKSNSSQSSPSTLYASSQPPQTEKDDLLAVSM